MKKDIPGYRKAEKHEVCCAACSLHLMSNRHKRRMVLCSRFIAVRVGALMTCDLANKPVDRWANDATI